MKSYKVQKPCTNSPINNLQSNKILVFLASDHAAEIKKTTKLKWNY